MTETTETIERERTSAEQEMQVRISALEETAHRAAYHIMSSHAIVGASVSFLILVAARMIYLGVEAAASEDKAAARGMVDHLSDNLIALADEFGLTDEKQE